MSCILSRFISDIHLSNGPVAAADDATTTAEGNLLVARDGINKSGRWMIDDARMGKKNKQDENDVRMINSI